MIGVRRRTRRVRRKLALGPTRRKAVAKFGVGERVFHRREVVTVLRYHTDDVVIVNGYGANLAIQEFELEKIDSRGKPLPH